MADIATLIRSDLGMQVAVTDMGGWDTHFNQGNHRGQLADRLRELADALAAFANDLGPLFSNVCVVTVTEFGRTVQENGTRGTDHGTGSVMTVLGGTVRGGKVYGQWKDLSPENLFERRDLPIHTDVRTVFTDILQNHLQWSHLSSVFPGFSPPEASSLKLIRT
jgi:uncharacterized protein (DUF1501 family)